MIAAAIGPYVLVLAAGVASGSGDRGARLTEFPPMFVATWGEGGPDCAQYPGRTVITPRSIRYRQWSAGVADASQLAHNQLRVRFRGDSSAVRATMLLTVGTTGTRLFIRRSGRDIAILTICEH